MDFGRVPLDALESIDFQLIPEPAKNKLVLSSGIGTTQFHIGLGSKGKSEWIGSVYPTGAKEKDYQQFYTASFNAIEVSSTFYADPTVAAIQKWKRQAGKDFLYCPKFPQRITHINRLKGGDMEIYQFLDLMRDFGDKLGPLFLMPHPSMGIADLPVIKQFIEKVPADFKLFLELRHHSFFDSGLPATLADFLAERGQGLVITDTAGRRDAVHMCLTIPEVYIRFAGNMLHPSDFSRIDEWVKRIKLWMEQGLEHCFFFIHQDAGLEGPKLVAYLIQQLNTHCGTTLQQPILKQQELF